MPCGACRCTPVLVVWSRGDLLLLQRQAAWTNVSLPDSWMFLELSSLCQSVYNLSAVKVSGKGRERPLSGTCHLEGHSSTLGMVVASCPCRMHEGLCTCLFACRIGFTQTT